MRVFGVGCGVADPGLDHAEAGEQAQYLLCPLCHGAGNAVESDRELVVVVKVGIVKAVVRFLDSGGLV